MNLYFIPLGSSGDINPFLGIGKFAASKNDRVFFLSNDNFKQECLAISLNFDSTGTKEEYIRLIKDANIHKPLILAKQLMKHLILKPTYTIYQILEEKIKNKTLSTNDIMIASPACVGARLINEKYKIPLISIQLAPMGMRSILDPSRFSPQHWQLKSPLFIRKTIQYSLDLLSDYWLKKEINQFRNQLNLPPINNILRWIESKEKILALFPEIFCPKKEDWPKHVTQCSFPLFNSNLDSENNKSSHNLFKNFDKPLLLFTQGTPNNKTNHFFNQSQKFIKDSPYSGIFLSKYKDGIPSNIKSYSLHNLNHNILNHEKIIHLDFLPFTEFLPYFKTIIHHGGIGTSSQCLAAGIPQIIVPWGVDQFDNSYRTRLLGVSAEILQANYSHLSLKKALAQLSQKSVKSACAKIQFKINKCSSLQEIYDQIYLFKSELK